MADPEPRVVSAALVEAVSEYDDGDYLHARQLAMEACREDADSETREQAGSLRRAIDADGIQLGVLLACTALFVAVVSAYFL